MILVTGSSGTIGKEVLKNLTAQGSQARAGYHTRPASIPEVENVYLDIATGDGFHEAFAGVDTVFLITGTMLDQTGAEIMVVEAAERYGVKRIVKLSVIGAESEGYTFAKIHRPVERAIEASGIPYTFLRPNGFMQNFVNYYIGTIKDQGAFYLPCQDARVSHVDVRDIARVAALTLTSEGHEGKAYDLTGPEALRYAEAASKLSGAVGRPITYVDIPEGDFKKSILDLGAPEAYADALIDLCRYYVEGHASLVTSDIKNVTGKDPISFDQFAHDYADALR